MSKQLLIAFALALAIQFMPGLFDFGPVTVMAQDALPDGDVGSERFMFDLNAVTHEGIEGSTRQGWIRQGINYFFERIISFMATVIGSLAVLTMSFGGLMMLTSGGGDASRYEKGKQMVLYSLVGLGVTLSAYILVTLVQLLIVSIYG